MYPHTTHIELVCKHIQITLVSGGRTSKLMRCADRPIPPVRDESGR